MIKKGFSINWDTKFPDSVWVENRMEVKSGIRMGLSRYFVDIYESVILFDEKLKLNVYGKKIIYLHLSRFCPDENDATSLSV